MQNKKDTTPQPRWVPQACFACPYITKMIVLGDVGIPVCGHPESFDIKGGILAVEAAEPPTEDCPFVHYEEKYKNSPIRRWFKRRMLRAKKRLDPR